MKNIATRFLLLLLMVSVSATSLTAASLPATEPVVTSEPVSEPAATTTKAEPSAEIIKSATDEFKNLSKHERKSRLKEAKKAFKEYQKQKKAGMSDDGARLLLLAILAILLPPLAVYLKEGEFNYKTVVALLLCFLAIIAWAWWLIPVLYALLVVFDVL